jgi:hypothetical protein
MEAFARRAEAKTSAVLAFERSPGRDALLARVEASRLAAARTSGVVNCDAVRGVVAPGRAVSDDCDCEIDALPANLDCAAAVAIRMSSAVLASTNNFGDDADDAARDDCMATWPLKPF